jgi:CheY-like chemotaxis protein
LTHHEATILAVDDDPDVLNLTISCLESLGYRAFGADGGQAAINTIATNRQIDLVMMDVAMPEINGVDTLRAILRERPDLPFLYMTGYTGATQLDASEQRVLKKPFTIAELARKVEEVLLTRGTKSLTNVVPINPLARSG